MISGLKCGMCDGDGCPEDADCRLVCLGQEFGILIAKLGRILIILPDRTNSAKEEKKAEKAKFLLVKRCFL